MDKRRRFVPGAVILLIVGVATMARFAPGVRCVAVVGLSGGGAALALGIAFLVLASRAGK